MNILFFSISFSNFLTKFRFSSDGIIIDFGNLSIEKTFLFILFLTKALPFLVSSKIKILFLNKNKKEKEINPLLKTYKKL